MARGNTSKTSNAFVAALARSAERDPSAIAKMEPETRRAVHEYLKVKARELEALVAVEERLAWQLTLKNRRE